MDQIVQSQAGKLVLVLLNSWEALPKKKNRKRKSFIVARYLAIDPGLELGEELVIPSLSETAIVSDFDTDDDNSGNYQKGENNSQKANSEETKSHPNNVSRGEHQFRRRKLQVR